MAIPGCGESVELLNFIFSSGIIFNDGHEILARLNAGDDAVRVIEDLAVNKFGRRADAAAVRQTADGWPPLHMEAVSRLVQWALGKLDTEDRVMIEWKGDPNHSRTVTRFELDDHTLTIEFAHPPAALLAGYTAR